MKKLMTSAMGAVLLGTTIVASVGTAAADPRRDRYIEEYYRDHDRDRDYVRWGRDRRNWRDDDYRRWYRDRHRGNNLGEAGAVAIFGLAAGAIVGAAVAGANNGRDAVVVTGGDEAWLRACSERYRSFDPASGTYLGYDGQRHPCRL
jgi:hypothetical protein